jgi:hypothetical protein
VADAEIVEIVNDTRGSIERESAVQLKPVGR